jgi:hypothetical protein
MKIVATVSGSSFLAEISAEEVKFLAGKKIGYEGNYSYEQRIPSGTTFDIVGAFAQIHRNNNRKREIESVRATLLGIINGLDLISPFIEEPKQEETAVQE